MRLLVHYSVNMPIWATCNFVEVHWKVQLCTNLALHDSSTRAHIALDVFSEHMACLLVLQSTTWLASI